MKINDDLIFCHTFFPHMHAKDSPLNIKEIKVICPCNILISLTKLLSCVYENKFFH